MWLLIALTCNNVFVKFILKHKLTRIFPASEGE